MVWIWGMEASSQEDDLKMPESMVPQCTEINTNLVTQTQIMEISDWAIEDLFFITQLSTVNAFFTISNSYIGYHIQSFRKISFLHYSSMAYNHRFMIMCNSSMIPLC